MTKTSQTLQVKQLSIYLQISHDSREVNSKQTLLSQPLLYPSNIFYPLSVLFLAATFR